MGNSILNVASPFKAIPLFLVLCNLNVTSATAAIEKCTASNSTSNGVFSAEVERLSDGDTVEVKTKNGKKRKIRLLYIDTPETHFQGRSQGEAGEVATRALEQMIPIGTQVEVRHDQVPCDMYGRFLGVLFKKNLEVNLEMVRLGYAASLCFAPNFRDCPRYTQVALEAERSGKSVFQLYQVQIPHEFRFEVSGRPEAPYVGDMNSKDVYSFDKFKKISPLLRVFFTKIELIEPPYSLVSGD